MHARMVFVCRCVLLVGLARTVSPLPADEPREANSDAPQTWALIVVGLPGDPERATRHADLAAVYERWFRVALKVSAERLLLVTSPASPEKTSLGGNHDTPRTATTQSLDSAFARLRQEMRFDDRLWLITLGHGNYDGRRAYFHVAGPDPPAEKWRQWLDSLPSANQTLWLTHSTSGWFVPVLSKKDRIVIAATATDEEANETEFPRALAKVLSDLLDRPAEKPDETPDSGRSVADLFLATTAEVERLYAEDKRVPTEHAQLDDNGDGRGSEKLSDMPTPKEDGQESRRRRW